MGKWLVLEVLLGPQAKGLSASTVSRLKQVCSQDYEAWREKSLADNRWLYLWADGIYSGLRSGTPSCAAWLSLVSMNKEKNTFWQLRMALASPCSWREVLLKLRARGMNDPQLAIGDVFWNFGEP